MLRASCRGSRKWSKHLWPTSREKKKKHGKNNAGEDERVGGAARNERENLQKPTGDNMRRRKTVRGISLGLTEGRIGIDLAGKRTVRRIYTRSY